ANAKRLPSFASTERMLASSDALYGLVAPYRKVGRFTARKAERVLCGEDAVADIPVEMMPEFSYQIRADVAQSLNILPNLSLLDYAEIIER
ncbi:MAG: ABC transporter substrate binding protein, partial [Boseongicola sp.]|nr:ABC transporter substrate binding protein [Boseongicola sp.]